MSRHTKRRGPEAVSPVLADGPTLLGMMSPAARRHSHVQRFAAGDAIVREDEPGGTAFILLSGGCEVTVRGDRLSDVRTNELFGDIACLEQSTRTATVRATADSEVLEIPPDVLLADLQRSPALLQEFLRALASRVRGMSRREDGVRQEHRDLRRVLENLQPSLDRFVYDPFVSLDVCSRPLTFASGDYYDVLELSPTRLLIAVGDIMGHGAATAPLYGMIRSQLHEWATPSARCDELAGHLHAHMRRHGHAHAFMTLTVMILDSSNRTAQFTVAGPPAPLVFSSGRCKALTDQVDWTLGYPFDDVTFHCETVNISPGDRFLIFTDGLSDAVRRPDPDGEWLGVEGVVRIFEEACEACSGSITAAIFEGIDRFRAGWPAEDDATALVVTIR
jgi:hypothetical protein